MLIKAIKDQNEDRAGNIPEVFKNKLKPVHCWSRNNKTHNWDAEVDPDMRKAIMANGRLYNC